MEPRFLLDDYKHRFQYRVRSHECDRQGVMHNARYLEMLEIARIEYSRDVLGIPIDAGAFATHHKFFFVHNSMDYFSPAQFDDELVIHTRVSRIGTSSVRFEQIVECATDTRRILEAEAVMVRVDERTDRPIPVELDLIERAKQWEGHRLL